MEVAAFMHEDKKMQTLTWSIKAVTGLLKPNIAEVTAVDILAQWPPKPLLKSSINLNSPGTSWSITEGSEMSAMFGSHPHLRTH
jgi:hypothetical protein